MRTLITGSENGTFSFKHGPLHRNPQKSGLGVDSCKGHDGLSLKDHREKGPNGINNLSSNSVEIGRSCVRWIYSEVFNQVSVHLGKKTVFYEKLV